jgi:hypothetical protein
MAGTSACCWGRGLRSDARSNHAVADAAEPHSLAAGPAAGPLTADPGPLGWGLVQVVSCSAACGERHVARYVERSALRAGLVRPRDGVDAGRWSSLGIRRRGSASLRAIRSERLVQRPRDWARSAARQARRAPGPRRGCNGLAIGREAWPSPRHRPSSTRCVATSLAATPFGDDAWSRGTEEVLGLERRARPRGRPGNDCGA